MTPRRTRLVAWWLLGVVAVSGGLAARAASATDDRGTPAVPRRAGGLPIVAEHHYRMAAKIRPFLLFWIGRDHVGGAHAVWRRSPEGTGYELLIGSDPTQAPRRINRWGYIAEEVQGSEARLLGVMKQSNEKSLEEAKANVAAEEQGGHYVFKAIRATADANEASAAVSTVRVTRDLTFRDVESLLDLLEREAAPEHVRRVPLPRGTRPGFLVALAELIHHDVADHSPAVTREARRRAVSIPYIYNGTLHDLTLRASERLRDTQVGLRRYRDVIHARFEARNRASGTATDFALLYGASGPTAEIPVYAVYQPRWWLQVELFLDEADQP
ncbi:MAG: hypothetical protein HYU37_02725 [Acidobacteria bacterium]|nr:hypothetical protein [Acidobacteriota bacterium]